MRVILDAENTNILDELDWTGSEGRIEAIVLDESMEGQMYTELTDDELTKNIFSAVHNAIVSSITQDEDDFYNVDPKEVLKKALASFE